MDTLTPLTAADLSALLGLTPAEFDATVARATYLADETAGPTRVAPVPSFVTLEALLASA